MAVTISAEVTRIWPQTEDKLAAATEFTYSDEKDRAIARAKLDAYGRHSVPSDEGDIPDLVAYWIADKAVIYLIPLAIEYYMLKEHLGTSKEGANITHYNKVEALRGLRRELETACAKGWADVIALAQPVAGDTDYVQRQYMNTPGVSVAGLLVQPLARAMDRGDF